MARNIRDDDLYKARNVKDGAKSARQANQDRRWDNHDGEDERRYNKRRTTLTDRRTKRRQEKKQAEAIRLRKQKQIANRNYLNAQITKAKSSKDLNKIRIRNRDLSTREQRRLESKLKKQKLKMKRKEFNKKDSVKVGAVQTGVDLSVGMIPVVGIFLAAGLNGVIGGANRVKNRVKSRLFVTGEDGETSIMSTILKWGIGISILISFLVAAVMGLVIVSGGIVSVLLSHPEAIRELAANNVLGDALFMGNVTEDVLDDDGNVLVKGRPDASPGCFIYNGYWYCGNCVVIGGQDSQREDCTPLPGNTGDPDNAGQGEFTDEAKEWAKDFDFTFIGDSLGVHVEGRLSNFFPKANFNSKSSRSLVVGPATDSMDGLNGIHILKTMAESNDIKDTLVVALGTNSGLTQENLNKFYDEIPSNVKNIVWINTGSKGGSDGYGNIDYEDIDKQMKEFAQSKNNVTYLDWLKYSHKHGWDKLTSDSVHMNEEGNELYSQFITQGLYDLFNGSDGGGGGSLPAHCLPSGDLGGVQIGQLDDSKLRDGVSVWVEEGIQPWPKRIMYTLSNLFPEVTEFSGYRGGGGDHGQGLAIDYMVSPGGTMPSSWNTGDAVARWLMDNFEDLNLSYVIWRQRMYPSVYTGGALQWQQMAHRGNITENHYDHLHISFNSGEGNFEGLKMPENGDPGIAEWDPNTQLYGGGGGQCDGSVYPSVCGQVATSGAMNYYIQQAKLGELDEHNHSHEIEVESPMELFGGSEGILDLEDIQDPVIQGQQDYLNRVMQRAVEMAAQGEAHRAIQNSSQYVGTADGPGIFHDTEGFTPGMMADWDLRSKDPSWLTGAYIDEFLSKNGYDKQPQFDDGVEGWPSKFVGKGDYIIQKSQEYGIAAGAFLGQVSMETSFGRTACGGPNNFGCMKKGTAPWRNWPSVWTYGSEGGTQDIEWEAPPTVEEGIDGWFDYVTQRYIDQGITKYAEFKEVYAPGEDGLNSTRNFEGYMFGTLRALGYDLTGMGGTKDGNNGSDNNTNNPNGYICADNCIVTDSEKEDGTGNPKALPKDALWDNPDELINSDLSYMPDTVTEETLNDFIEGEGPNNNGFIGMGDIFMEASQKSGYDARYLLAHAAVTSNWGRSEEWKTRHNPYLLFEEGDNNSVQLMRFKDAKDGIITGAQTLYKNYYSGGQKTLYEMNNSEDGTHNITNDPEWPAKVAAYMKKTEDYMGASTGGSLNSDGGADELEARPIESSHLAQRASLGRSCALNEVVMENLPVDLDLNPLVGVGAWFHDPNYVGVIHNGMDISYEDYVEGPLYATADGVVDTIVSNCTVGDQGCGDNWGNYVKIKHDFEGEVYYTQYAHMKSINLSVGDEVRAGQEIGIMGTTGLSTGNHVHFELWRGDTRIDPYDYFDWTELNLHAPHMSGRDPECELGGVARTKPGGPSRDEECIVESPGGNSDIGNLVGNDNAEKIYHFFKDNYNFTDEGIAGMLGNMQWESGVSPTRIQSLSADETANSTSAEMDDYFDACPGSSYGPGMGLIQWETNYCGIESGGPRFDSLTAWAKSTGKDRWKLETQLEWLTFEMGLEPAPAGTDVWVATASYSIGNQETFEAAMRGNSIEEAVEHFERSVERAGDVRMAERVSAAKEFYAEMDNWK